MNQGDGTALVVFSKDRALQLDAFLRSLNSSLSGAENVTTYVLWAAGSDADVMRYRSLEREHPTTVFVREFWFFEQLVECLRAHQWVGLFVDDTVFVQSWSLTEVLSCLEQEHRAIGFSLRLGRNTSYCFAKDMPQKVPEFHPITDGCLGFDWTRAELDFAYPLELSSSVYASEWLLELLTPGLAIRNPNDLETHLDSCKNHWIQRNLLCCYPVSVAFSNAVNTVSLENGNRIGENLETDLADLNECFDKGNRIRVEAFWGLVPNACHQACAYAFERAMHRRPELKDLVSVVIPCYNYGQFVEAAVDSVLRQTLQPSEVIVVDGGSDAPTLEVLSRLEGRKCVSVHYRQGRHWVGDNRNFGISLARTPFVCCLDADDQLRQDHLEKAMLRLVAGSADVVGTSKRTFGEAQKAQLVEEWVQPEELLEENQVNTTAVFKHSLWRAVGGYEDTGLGDQHYYEDWHYWIKCSLAGARICNLANETSFFYRLHANTSLSQQSNQVPNLEQQRNYIQSQLLPRLKSANPTDHSVSEGLEPQIGLHELSAACRRTHSRPCVLVITDSLTTEWWESRWPAIRSQRVGRCMEDWVIVAIGEFQDREDALGTAMWAEGVQSFDYRRSFDSMPLHQFLSYLIERRHTEEVLLDVQHPEPICSLLRLHVPTIPVTELETSVQRSDSLTVSVAFVNSGQANSASSGKEVWILAIRDSRGLITATSLFVNQQSDGFQVLESRASPIGRAILLQPGQRLDCDLKLPLSIEVLQHDWSGVLTIEVNGSCQDHDLYSGISGKTVIELSVPNSRS